MSSETRKMILDTIIDLSECPLGSTIVVENWLYGSFDGYNYYEVAIQSNELSSITAADPELGAKIVKIFDIINEYPTLNFA
jgi:hypothetical protein